MRSHYLAQEANIRLDHIAYRVADRHKTVDFFVKSFDYRVQTEFDIDFGNGETARCFALEPPEKVLTELKHPWQHWMNPFLRNDGTVREAQEYHLAPEIFVSDGTPDSIVGRWVAHRDGIGGIHHLAYQVNNVKEKMDEWKEKGYAEFTTEEPLTCPGLTQVFTKPSALTGVIYEFIERGAHGFCAANVRELMISTDNLK